MKQSVYSGSGNTFLLIDNRDEKINPEALDIPALSKGKDGVIVLQTPLAMRIFNADGSEAEMCGNGARCLLAFYRELTGFLGRVTLLTKAGPIQGSIGEQSASIFLPLPKEVRFNNTLPGISKPFHTLDTGVPHAVFFVTDLEGDPLIQKGHELKDHPFFGKRGSNINFVENRSGTLHIRTFERGLSHESPACGTGASAAAFAAIQILKIQKKVTLIPKSGDPLVVTLRDEGLELEGSVFLLSS